MENQTVNNNDEVEIDLGEVFHLLLSKLGVTFYPVLFSAWQLLGNHASDHTEV